jgi:hypothetical protein
MKTHFKKHDILLKTSERPTGETAMTDKAKPPISSLKTVRKFLTEGT